MPSPDFARGSFWVCLPLGTAFDNYALWGTALGTTLSPCLTLLLAVTSTERQDDALVRWLKWCGAGTASQMQNGRTDYTSQRCGR